MNYVILNKHFGIVQRRVEKFTQAFSSNLELQNFFNLIIF